MTAEETASESRLTARSPRVWPSGSAQTRRSSAASASRCRGPIRFGARPGHSLAEAERLILKWIICQRRYQRSGSGLKTRERLHHPSPPPGTLGCHLLCLMPSAAKEVMTIHYLLCSSPLGSTRSTPVIVNSSRSAEQSGVEARKQGRSAMVPGKLQRVAGAGEQGKGWGGDFISWPS